MDAGDQESGVTLAELVAAFSLTTDLGLGQPLEHVLRSWVIAARLGDHVGLELSERDALYYVATLAWVGCVADTPELAAWFGDDIAFRGDSRQIDLAGVPMMGFMLRHVGVGSPALHRLRLGASFMVKGAKGVERALLSHCLTTAQMAERLGLDSALEAIADFTDLRSPSRAGHSRCTAELAARAAVCAAFPEPDVTMVRRAGLVHDIGMHGLPATILDKAGPLSASEAERIR